MPLSDYQKVIVRRANRWQPCWTASGTPAPYGTYVGWSMAAARPTVTVEENGKAHVSTGRHRARGHPKRRRARVRGLFEYSRSKPVLRCPWC